MAERMVSPWGLESTIQADNAWGGGKHVPHATWGGGAPKRFPRAHERVPGTRRGWEQGSTETPFGPWGGGLAQTQPASHPAAPPRRYSRFREGTRAAQAH